MQVKADTICTIGIATLMLVLSVTAFSRTDIDDPTQGWANGSYQRGFETRFERSIPAHENAIALWAAAKWLIFREPAGGAVAGAEDWLFTAEEFQEPVERRDLAAELARVSDVLAREGMALVPVVVPDKARMQAFRLRRGRSEGFDQRYARALTTISALGLPVVDLRPALSSEGSFMRTDTHWSPAGAQRAAEAIAEALGELDLPQVDVQTVAFGESRFEGDLLTFVATGRLREVVGPSPEMIARYETSVAVAGGLFGEANIPVALVGTSFSARSDFHFEGFLKQALQLDILNVSRVGQGPFVPMDAFLENRAAYSSLPSIVVWEIPERFLTTRRDFP
ncbi:alginate O-acetyltransferase AlgX-related protein [Shimia sp. MMG029]|uniref:alginate O-acetyltransferase AlgX-related protein n=1 Tax=Shimia sp. MMG029 TaxID=3021978 RepID=UPI0022FEFD16|nr:hypothetical protein [Shimia sp. MMG029]MDA5557656.1 hypothetical protein [Shimia sp. MMG029]